MDADFINVYTEVLLENAEAVIRQNFMLQAKLKVMEKTLEEKEKVKQQFEKSLSNNEKLNIFHIFKTNGMNRTLQDSFWKYQNLFYFILYNNTITGTLSFISNLSKQSTFITLIFGLETKITHFLGNGLHLWFDHWSAIAMSVTLQHC